MPKGKLLPIKSFILRLDPHIRALALENMRMCPTGLSSTKVYKLSDALKLAFYWHKSPEGKDYWSHMYVHAVTDELNAK